MSTITSPRPSITSLATPTSSRRPSFDSSRSPSRPPTQAPPRRGNRAALRDYYGIKASTDTAAVQAEPTKKGGDEEESELDRDGFSADEYLERVLEREGLEGVLRVEGGLVNEIRGLDGERKALVYDNYSKLITATDTIRKMRSNMDPLTPTTSTLPPALSHIAETAASLATALQERTTPSHFSPSFPRHTPAVPSFGGTAQKSEEERRTQRRKEAQTVKWVLDAPRRIRETVGEGKREEAEREWEAVKELLDKWEGVAGADQVREEGEEALKGD